MKFVFAVRKMGAADIGRARGHNCREHPTASQLPDPAAWFGKRSHVPLVQWKDAPVERARALAKRKDAVVGIEVVVQVGNQVDWRLPPTPECPEGAPKRPHPVSLKKLADAAKAWAIKEFGESNIVSIEAHLDESTPHIQIVATPVHDGKLQAKHWLNGPAAVAGLRRRAHQVVNRAVPCDYEPGCDNGGKPHDPGQRAGVAPVPEPPGLLDRLTAAPDRRRMAELEAENDELRRRNSKLEQVVRSRAKALATAQRQAADAKTDRQQLELAKSEAKRLGERVRTLEPLAEVAGLFTPSEVATARLRAERAATERAEASRSAQAEANKKWQAEQAAEALARLRAAPERRPALRRNPKPGGDDNDPSGP